jgi:hypothetical protein
MLILAREVPFGDLVRGLRDDDAVDIAKITGRDAVVQSLERRGVHHGRTGRFAGAGGRRCRQPQEAYSNSQKKCATVWHTNAPECRPVVPSGPVPLSGPWLGGYNAPAARPEIDVQRSRSVAERHVTGIEWIFASRRAWPNQALRLT